MHPTMILAAVEGSLSTSRWILILLISGGIGAAIGSSKNRMGLGFVLGALLGCIGWIIMLFLPRK